MPLFVMKEIWTPLKYLGVKLFKCLDDHSYYIKIGQKTRKKISFF